MDGDSCFIKLSIFTDIMELPKNQEEKKANEPVDDQTEDSENSTPNKENDTETDNKPPEDKDTDPNAPKENNTNAEAASNDDPVNLDDILSQIVKDTIIDSPTKTDQSTPAGNVTNNKRKPPNNPPKQPAKARRQAEPRIRSAPSVFLQRSSRAPPVPKPVPRKNLADQYNNCVHGDPGDYLCVDCFYNRWRSEWDFLQPIPSK